MAKCDLPILKPQISPRPPDRVIAIHFLLEDTRPHQTMMWGSSGFVGFMAILAVISVASSEPSQQSYLEELTAEQGRCPNSPLKCSQKSIEKHVMGSHDIPVKGSGDELPSWYDITQPKTHCYSEHIKKYVPLKKGLPLTKRAQVSDNCYKHCKVKLPRCCARPEFCVFEDL